MMDDATILHSAFSIVHSALLAGAAASFAAYLAMRHARRIALASDWLTHVPRPRLAAFLAFALVAMIHAQKSGTNAPLRGASVELRAESGKWEVESDGAVAAGDSVIQHSTLSTLHSSGRTRGERLIVKLKVESGKWRVAS